MKSYTIVIIVASVLALGTTSRAEIKIVADHNSNESATPSFKFKNVPSPVRSDAAALVKFTIVDGEKDANAGDVDKLHDGRVPGKDDQPAENFFFNAGTKGGRVLVDLDNVIDIKQVNTYSWHRGARGPQVYKLYGSDGTFPDFNAQPKGIDPRKCGWKLVAEVDTRPKEGASGGQYGVSVSDSEGIIGKYRYLLFDIARTEDTDRFGNTFYSEIDVIDRDAPPVVDAPATPMIETTVTAEGGKYEIIIDTSAAPDLAEWVQQQLAPVAQEWYPKIVKLLPSERYQAPTNVTIRFREGMGGTPASTSGDRINCNVDWFRQNLKGEARGAVVHEMVHVVQQYGQARRAVPPGWLVEGIADYIRWFLYEPQSKGAEITQRYLARARYDAGSRMTGNFLNWVTEKYDKDTVRILNAVARDGNYSDELWKSYTGKTLQELGDEWKKSTE